MPKNSNKIEASWVVCGMDGFPVCDPRTYKTKEFKTEAQAIKRAKEHVQTSDDSEAWVFRLSHVVARPKAEPDVEKVS